MPPTPQVPLRKRLPRPSYSVRDVRGYGAQRQAVWGVVRKFTGHPDLIDWAADFIRAYQIPERDNAAFARALQQYAQEHIQFFRERPERFASPLRTLQWGIGDCDDKSIFIATVLRSFRIPVRLRFIRYRKQLLDGTRKTISHVYPQAQLDGQWVTLESVHPWPMGKDPEQEALRKGYRPHVETIGP